MTTNHTAALGLPTRWYGGGSMHLVYGRQICRGVHRSLLWWVGPKLGSATW